MKKNVGVKKNNLLLHSDFDDSLAQLVEHLPFKQRVPGSSPGRVTQASSLFVNSSGLFLLP